MVGCGQQVLFLALEPTLQGLRLPLTVWWSGGVAPGAWWVLTANDRKCLVIVIAHRGAQMWKMRLGGSGHRPVDGAVSLLQPLEGGPAAEVAGEEEGRLFADLADAQPKDQAVQ